MLKFVLWLGCVKVGKHSNDRRRVLLAYICAVSALTSCVLCWHGAKHLNVSDVWPLAHYHVGAHIAAMLLDASCY
jgi:hypothetical protein